ncbi:Alpha/Beta hydrolase protein [Powellomyces hirtus]|nr:Alpha/Beta hydrolase protein [Powellomyces hirtus]
MSSLAQPTPSLLGQLPDLIASQVLLILPPSATSTLRLHTFSSHDLFLLATIAAALTLLLVVYLSQRLFGKDQVRIYHADTTTPVRSRTGLTQLHQLVRAACPSLIDPLNKMNAFRPTWYLFNGHLQTIYAAFFAERGTRDISYHRELIYFPDGGNVALDWHPAIIPSPTPAVAPDVNDQDTPIVVILHGLTGGSHETYVRELCYEVAQRGYRAVVVNFRGCAESELTSMQLYCGAWTHDLRTAVAFVRRRYPTTTLFAVGFSLGANILTKFVGESGEHCPFIGAISVSNPFDLLGGSRALHRTWIGRNLYSKTMTQNLIRMFKKHHHLYVNSHTVNTSKVLASKYIYQFDTAFTSKMFGYRTVHEYYRMASSAQYLPDVRIPMLLLTALDDPIVDPEILPIIEVKNNPHLLMATTKHGGHIGWYEGALNPRRWIPKPLGEFLGAIIQAHCSLPADEQVARVSAANPLNIAQPFNPVPLAMDFPSHSLDSVRDNKIVRDKQPMASPVTPTITTTTTRVNAAASSPSPKPATKPPKSTTQQHPASSAEQPPFPLSRATRSLSNNNSHTNSKAVATIKRQLNPLLMRILAVFPQDRLLVLLLGALAGFIGRAKAR